MFLNSIKKEKIKKKAILQQLSHPKYKQNIYKGKPPHIFK